MATDRTSTIITTLFSYMDKPWKVLSIIILVVVGVIMFTVYERRETIATTILYYYSRPRLRLDRFREIAVPMMQHTHADVTQLWSMNLESNHATPIAGYRSDGTVWIPNPATRPVIHQKTDPKLYIELIHGNVFCATLPSNPPLFRLEYAAGLRRVCAIGVPQTIGMLSGFMYLGWFKPLSAEEEFDATTTLEVESHRITD